MRSLLRLEQLALFACALACYHLQFSNHWTLFLCCFLVPDISFLAYLINPKIGAIAYNILHHQGVWIAIGALTWSMHSSIGMQLALIGFAHSTFDRILGYGLKYSDSFEHTHLGWIGKSISKNVSNENH